MQRVFVIVSSELEVVGLGAAHAGLAGAASVSVVSAVALAPSAMARGVLRVVRNMSTLVVSECGVGETRIRLGARASDTLVRVNLVSSRFAFLRHHLCELALLAALGVPLIAIRPDWLNIGIAAGLSIVLFVVGYLSDAATTLRADADGVEYVSGGRVRTFVAWSEVAQVVPRGFSAWPAEDALVLLDRRQRPLLVATTSMFDDDDVVAVREYMSQYVDVSPFVKLSPFTARADGKRRPELVPERTSERFLVSATTAFVLTAIVALVVYAIFD